jgi:multicomponent K+:H+ antiporter subunit E
VVTYDIVLANIAVARLILGSPTKLRPLFVEFPLDLTQPMSISLLASIITMTPGTVSADLSEDSKLLLIHALDCDDPARLIGEIKHRYEKPLMEIFGC